MRFILGDQRLDGLVKEIEVGLQLLEAMQAERVLSNVLVKGLKENVDDGQKERVLLVMRSLGDGVGMVDLLLLG